MTGQVPHGDRDHSEAPVAPSGDYPAAIRSFVGTVQHLAATEAEVARLLAECADRESERADLRDRLTKAEGALARVEALAKVQAIAYRAMNRADHERNWLDVLAIIEDPS